MDCDLTKELIDLRKAVQDFCRKGIRPYLTDWRANHYYPVEEVIKKMGELGFYAPLFPEKFEGLGMHNAHLANVLITEIIASEDMGLRVAINMALGAGYPILKFGTKEQKKKFLPGIVTGENLGCFCITEPGAGTDVMSISTTAEKVEEGWLINGTKTFITHAQQATRGIGYFRTDPNARGKGLSAFIFDPNNTPGITTLPIEKPALPMSPTGQIFFDNALLPEDSLLGNEGDGAKIVFTSLNTSRLGAAAGGIGGATGAFNKAVQYAKEREQFGQAIGNFQGLQFQLADMKANIELAREFMYACARQKDSGATDDQMDVAITKLAASKLALDSAQLGLLVHGAYTYEDGPAWWFYQDAGTAAVVEGSMNACRMIIANALGLGKKKK
ncbi:MAG: acyl-CoA dehydrogenase family protein [Nanoarchaeota archaeon]